uniref:Zinc finger and BTB domain containing 21 n=1 Tax=Salmo trutta TaxID=8032 RepID=A0A673ZSW3_SALTR
MRAKIQKRVCARTLTDHALVSRGLGFDSVPLKVLNHSQNAHFGSRMESLVHYSNPSHGLSVLGVLNEQRLRGQLCDTVLVVGDQRYQAHRSVLAASSEYFQSLFTRMESEPHKVIQLDFCEPDAFEIVLNYIYSSSLFVDRGSLAAIQELGYSLGIPFLTNIMSTRPHVSYCVSRKRLSFSEDDNDIQLRSVIVRQSRRGDAPGAGCYGSNDQGEQTQASGHRKPNESATNTASNPRKSAEATGEGSDSKPISSYASILKGKTSSHTGSSVRPQLTSSVSFSESPTVVLQSDLSTKEEEEQQRLYRSKPQFQGQVGEPSQTIDRSGPLIKSLLRRSLSMDSPVPVFSPTLELNKLQGREQSVVKMVANTEEGIQTEYKQSVKVVLPLLLKSRHHSRYDDKDETPGKEFHVKTEPSSPLCDPSEIIRITVGDSLPVNLKNNEMDFDQGPTKPFSNLPGKRRVRRDNRRYPFKKSKGVNEHDFPYQPSQRENTDTEVYSCRLCNEKLSSLFEQGDHERGCRHATVCPYCGLRFSSPAVKKEHEAHCKYKKLTCLECMRTFKSSFSIWRHQVEVHNHNIMTVKEQLSHREENNGEVSDHLGRPLHTQESVGAGSSREDIIYSDSSGPPMLDSDDSSSFVPEDLNASQCHNEHHGELTVKDEPIEEAVSEREDVMSGASVEPEEPGVWPCEKCGKLFGGHKDLERHQELLCHIKPFICHICNKAFRTNFRLWSHFQSHMSTSDEPGAREVDDRLVTHATGCPAPQVFPPKPVEADSRPEMDRSHGSPLPKMDSVDNSLTPQESETLFYHAPTLSALTFKRQYMCKLCHRTFKTAFSLWSHEKSHSHI